MRYLAAFLIIIAILSLGCSQQNNQFTPDIPTAEPALMELRNVGFLPGGQINAVEVIEEKVYVGFESSFMLLDLSEPMDIRVVTSIRLPSKINDIQIYENYAYVSLYDSWNGIYVIDISNSAVPSVVGSFETTTLRSFAFFEGYIYSTHTDYSSDPIQRNKLRIFDVSSPEAIKQVAEYDIGSIGQTSLGSLVINENYLFLDVHHQFPQPRQLQIFDISIPLHPKSIGLFDLSEGYTIDEIMVIEDLAIVSTHLDYEDIELSDHKPEIIVFDIQDPTSLIEIARYPGWDAITFYPYLYILTSEDTWLILNLSNPSSPEQIGHIDSLADTNFIGDSGLYRDRLLISSWNTGLEVVDISNPLRPLKISHYGTMGSIGNLNIIDEIAYVTSGYVSTGSFRIVDFSEPEQVAILSTIDMQAFDIAIIDEFAFITSWDKGLSVVDISDPLEARIVANKELSGWAHHIAVDDHNFIYLVSGWEMWILDASDPLNLREVGYYSEPVDENSNIYPPTNVNYHGIVVVENHAFLVTDGYGLQIFDVSDRENPEKVEVYHDPDSFYRIAKGGQFIYLVSRKNELVVLDVSNPLNPEFQTSIPITNYYTDELFAEEDIIYLPLRTGGIDVFQLMEID